MRSLEAALRFYKDALGMTPGPSETVATEKVTVAMLDCGGLRL